MDSDNNDNTNISKISIQERFERAKIEQERLKEEKIRNLKNVYSIKSSGDNESNQRQSAVQSLKQTMANKQSEAAAGKAERLKQFLGTDKMNKRGSVMGKWDSSVIASRSIAQQQFNDLREQTMTGFRTAGPGFVKNRAGEFEKICMAKKASETAIIAAIHAGKLASIQREKLTKESRKNVTPKAGSPKKAMQTPKDDNAESIPIANFEKIDDNNVEDINSNNDNSYQNEDINRHSNEYDIREFEVAQTSAEPFCDGATHVYELKSISSSLQGVFENALKTNNMNQHTLLPCGIYSDGDMPPIEILAVAMKTVDDEGDDNSYISITINVCEGCEGLRSAYGLFKVAIFPPNSTEASDAFERFIDFQPRNGWDNWEPEPEQDIIYNDDISITYADPEVDASSSRITDNTITDNSITDNTMTADPIIDNTNDTIIDNTNDTIFDNTNDTITDYTITDNTITDDSIKANHYHDDVDNDDDDMVEVETEEVEAGGVELDNFIPGEDEPIFNYGRSLCITSGQVMPKYFGPCRDESDPEYIKSWTIADESSENLPDSVKDKFKLNVRSIVAISSSANCLIIQTTTGSMVVTGTLKSATSNSQLIVRNNTIFEWVRGAAMSGILYKWPLKSKGNFKSRLSAKFFVIRDNEVCYHSKRPTSDILLTSSKSFTVSANSTISTGRHLLLPCLTVTTPQDTLWLRTGKNAIITQKWIREVRNGIAFNNRKKIFYSKERIESFWHHEADNFNCVSVDGLVVGPGKYTHVALFLLDSSKSLTKGREHHTDVNNPYIHSIDLSLTGLDRQQYELYSDTNMNAVMSTDIGSKLTCIKLLNNLFVFGGDRGYIGIGRIRDFRQGTVVYCTSPAVPFNMSDGDMDNYSSPGKGNDSSFYFQFIARKGHAPDAQILCLDVIHDFGIFAGGDDNGIVTLWMLDNNINGITAGGRMILQNVLKVSTLGQNLERHEKICSLQFLAEEKSLLITTNERLLYVTLQQNSEGTYFFDSWVELDSVLPDCQAYFTLSIENKDGKKSMILWKIVGEPYHGKGSTPMVGKAEDAIIFRLKYDDLYTHFLNRLQKIN